MALGRETDVSGLVARKSSAFQPGTAITVTTSDTVVSAALISGAAERYFTNDDAAASPTYRARPSSGQGR